MTFSSTELETVPWYLQVDTPTPQQEHPFAERQKLPDLPESPPALLQPILEHVSVELGLDHLSLIDLRELDPPPALGANLLMIIGTARSEKHLHVSADRLCRWLRTEHHLTPYADGLLGRNELKLKLRRKAKRSRLLSAVGAKETASQDLDDGIRTGWVCVNVGRVEGGALQKPAEEMENIVGFGSQSSGSRIVVQMMTDEKRGQIDLETLWSGILKRSIKAKADKDQEVDDAEKRVRSGMLLEESTETPGAYRYRPHAADYPSGQQARAYHSSARSSTQQGAQISTTSQIYSQSDRSIQSAVILNQIVDHLKTMSSNDACQALGNNSNDQESTPFLRAFYSAMPSVSTYCNSFNMSNNVKNMHICIAGSGMGGLACALSLARQGFTKISVYEYASNLGFVGAGIQLAPNMARILDRLNVWEPIQKEAVDLKDTSIRQGSTDAELANVKLGYVRETYGYPHMVGHRSSLAGEMYKGCKEEAASITFHFSHSVQKVHQWSPKVKFQVQPREGEAFDVECDVLLAADGVKSNIRDQMLALLNIDAKVVDSGQAAYRIMLKREEMEHDPELLELIDAERATRWIGERRHIIAYPVSNNTIYNLSTAQPDVNFAAAPSATYTTKGSKKEMLEVYADFCPKIQKMLNMVPEGEVCEWKLRVHAPLPTWVHGNMALVGDACHPTLPHLAQGAAQAIEDGAVLGVVLSKLPDTSSESINKALKVYQELRKSRAEGLVALAAANGREMHLGDGAAKEARDAAFKAIREGREGAKVPDRWADADVQKMIYGHDCWKDAEEQFETLFAAA
ncbi:putative monooxygenase, partial [Aureobasidium melanogenum]